MRDILRWLPARQRIEYRMAALVWRCLLGLAPAYILLSSAAPHKMHGALAPTVQPIEVFSVCHLHAPPPGRSVPNSLFHLEQQMKPEHDTVSIACVTNSH